MILIADSGSTKTDWALIDGTNVLKKVNTQGINPFHQYEDIRRLPLGPMSIPSGPRFL